MHFLIQNVFALFGRILLSAFFVVAAYNRITNWGASAKAIADRLGVGEFAGVPLAHVLLAGAVVLLVFGSVSLLIGFRTRTGAFLLLVVLIPATIVNHDFWVDPTQFGQFVKNISLMGGLLTLMAHGGGTLGLDVFTYRPHAYRT